MRSVLQDPLAGSAGASAFLCQSPCQAVARGHTLPLAEQQRQTAYHTHRIGATVGETEIKWLQQSSVTCGFNSSFSGPRMSATRQNGAHVLTL